MVGPPIVPGEGGGVPSREWIAKTWRGQAPVSHDWVWYWMYRARGGLRPGAIPLARVNSTERGFLDDRGDPLPVFATMDFGKGTVFWSSLDSISRIRRGQRDRVYGAFWEQVIRYLATYRLLGGNKRFKIFTDKNEYFVGETAEIDILAFDQYYEPLDEEFLDGVHIELVDDPTQEGDGLLTGNNRPESLRGEGASGTYRKYLMLRKPGLVRVWIETKGPTGSLGASERAEKRFEVRFRAREDILKAPDHETLREIMELTNPSSREAKVLKLSELKEFVAQTQARPTERVLDRRERTQWDRSWVLLVITALLAIEWLLRKRWQMI